MNDQELKRLLRRWGSVFGVKPPPEWDEDTSEGTSGSTHALLRSVRAASKTEARRTRKRQFINAAGQEEEEEAPENVCFGRDTRGGAKPMFIPPDAEAVEIACLELHRIDRVRATVLRMEYCAGRIGLSEKAQLAGKALELRIKRSRFRYELGLAHAWMAGRLSSRVAA